MPRPTSTGAAAPLSTRQRALVHSLLGGDLGARELRLEREFLAGRLDDQVLTRVVPKIWRYRVDGCPVPAATWLEMFHRVAFTTDFAPAPPPRLPLRLYRGATLDGCRGLAWSLRLDQAVYSASFRRDPFGPQPLVWMTVAPPEVVLARFVETSWHSEVVIDATRLPVWSIDATRRSTRMRARLPAWQLRRSQGV